MAVAGRASLRVRPAGTVGALTRVLQEDGRPVQYFQRARLEYREELKGTRDEVQLVLIGDEVLRQKDWLE